MLSSFLVAIVAC